MSIDTRELPIIFSAPMVRAILEGRKTVTRRLIRNQGLLGNTEWTFEQVARSIGCPYGQSGGVLWVRETWRVGAWFEDDASICVDYQADDYSRPEPLSVTDEEQWERLWVQSTDDAVAALGAHDSYEWVPGDSPCRWRRSIHMPRWACRLRLNVTKVRVERLQEITYGGAIREGVGRALDEQQTDVEHINFTLDQFARLWDQINAKRAPWESNPWVWVVEFERSEQ